jgi:hypothetical protein
MYAVVGEHVFPFLRTLGGDDSTYAHHMKDARFTIPTPALLAKVVDMLDAVPMEDRDTKGDLYEYMLGKIASAGQNGQFRTPRHIIQLMVELTAPHPDRRDLRPGLRHGGFLVAAGEYLREHHPSILHDAKLREEALPPPHVPRLRLRQHHAAHRQHEHAAARRGEPDIRYRDSLAQDHAGEEEKYTLVLANPPFAGSLDYENTAKDLLQIVKTKKTELLFLALFLRLLKPGGRAAVIVPDGVLFGSARRTRLRRMLVEDQKLDAVIKLPGGVFKPYAGVSTAILLFTKTNSGGTDHVWFYDVEADGWSLDDKRTPLLPEDKLGPCRDRAHRGRAREEQPARRARPLGAARRAERRTPAHRAELLRAQGRHRRAGLRPLAQPLQGSGARGGRAPRAEGDPRRPGEAGGGDPAGDEGTGGDGCRGLGVRCSELDLPMSQRSRFLFHLCPNSGGLRRFWTRRTNCGPSAAPPSPSSTASPNPSSSTCSAIQSGTTETGQSSQLAISWLGSKRVRTLWLMMKTTIQPSFVC